MGSAVSMVALYAAEMPRRVGAWAAVLLAWAGGAEGVLPRGLMGSKVGHVRKKYLCWLSPKETVVRVVGNAVTILKNGKQVTRRHSALKKFLPKPKQVG